MINIGKNLFVILCVSIVSVTNCMDRKKTSIDQKNTSSLDSPRTPSGKKSPKGSPKGLENTGLTSSAGTPKTSVKSLSELQAIMAKRQSERAQSEGSGSIK